MAIDRDRWTAPSVPEAPDPTHLRGVLYGTRLFEQPAHRAVAEGVAEFLAPPGPVAVEIGFDHGMRLLDQARRHPGWRWLGVELRRARVEAAAPHAPANARLLRMDGRTLLAALVPPERLDAVILWFPAPSDDPRHLLLTPALVELLRRALAPHGVVHFATDVPGLARWADEIFAGWTPGADPPPPSGALSRRERVCRRDGIPVHERCWRRP